MANVFVSHRRDDMAEAEELANNIKAAGHNVWLDEWEINLGDSITQKMNEGLTGSSYVVVCYSSFGIDSPWMSREWYSSLARQLNGVDVTLLPVKLTGGEAPAIIADIKYADLVKDHKQGLNDLLKAIR